MIKRLITKIKQSLCHHDYQWHVSNRESIKSNTMSQLRVLVCTQCNHMKRDSMYSVEFRGTIDES